MFASNIIAKDEYVRHLRGRENLKSFSQTTTIGSGKRMTNWFCQTCGTLLYRIGEDFPGVKILRLGTVDDFNLAEVKFLISFLFYFRPGEFGSRSLAIRLYLLLVYILAIFKKIGTLTVSDNHVLTSELSHRRSYGLRLSSTSKTE